MANYNRRQFLTRSTLGFAGATMGLSMLATAPARAANVGGYKAIVGIMLKGGMDHNDTVLPMDAESYHALKSVREGIFANHNSDHADSSRNLNNILSLDVQDAARFNGRRFGLPRELSSVRDMFNAGEAAIVGNVGPLLEAADRDDLETGRVLLPKRIFSHNDQQSTWMALGTEGTRQGWGGQFADAVINSGGASNPLYTAITATSPDVFLSGTVAQPFRIPKVGSQLSINGQSKKWYLGYGDDRDAAREKLAEFLRRDTYDHENLFRQDAVRKNAVGLSNQIAYSDQANAATPLATIFPDTNLGRQLGGVAQAMSLRSTLGVNRQVFYTSQGGYDTHDSQGIEIPVCHEELGGALAAFRQAMLELGTWDDVLVFTMSDFGRSMVGNGDGSDHGWGAHHFVLGGSVRGGHIYGDIPEVDLGHPQLTEQRGRLIPTTSVEQHAAALGRWFGLDDGELNNIFPNLSRFDRTALSFA